MTPCSPGAFRTTLECRWFADGELPRPLAVCLSRDDPNSRWSDRVDRYLAFPTARSVGVKLREGALEIKAWVRGCGEQQFPGPGIGRVEVWEKWRGESALAAEAAKADTPRAARWPAVHKRRRSWAYRPAPGGPQPAGPDAADPDLCAVELVELRVGGRLHASVALEAELGGPAEPTQLVAVFERFLSDRGVPADSFQGQAWRTASYPDWLPTVAIAA